MRQIQAAFVLYTFVIMPSFVYAASGDHYGFLYWIDGWRGRASNGQRLLGVQTSRYGAVFDVEKVHLTRLGEIVSPLSYVDAAAQSPDVMGILPAASLNLTVTANEKKYHCIGTDLSALKGLESPSRIIESGRFVQRFDIQGLRFVRTDGGTPDLTARLEVIAWPERLALILEVAVNSKLSSVVLNMTLEAGGKTLVDERAFPDVASGDNVSARIIWHADDESVALDNAIIVAAHCAEESATLPIRFDECRSWFQVELPAKHFDLTQAPEHADRYDITVRNMSDISLLAPLVFSIKGSFTGITGMLPMLLDAHGTPTGLPVQISKNWHSKPDAPELYEGPWFRGFALVPVSAGEAWEGRLQIVYAHWGGVPAASHAQLCLVGWGVNQLWDQVAIGSWGETICYDPDINLNRSMIDDIRPLMVHGMGGTPEKPALWTWTNNVGGGDFLTLFDARGKRRFPSRMRTAYLKYGPNLTEVVYAGVTDDGTVEMRMTVSSPRCDDVARAYHHIRYDVVKPVAFSRLAFYQLGADNYNDHQFGRIARGNGDGIIEEWGFQPGGMVYDRTGIHCEGNAPWWFSAHQAVPNAPRGGAWANRGLIVRKWEARLGGKVAEQPYAAFFGTENGVPGMNVELAPPPELKQLEPGDFVDALLELVVIPMAAADYYGPNDNLRAHLKEHANSWQPVHRLARLNDLQVEVTQGTPLRSYPILVQVDENQAVKFSVHGGAGYAPCTITGVSTPENMMLQRVDATGSVMDACNRENQYKQVDWNNRDSCYQVTYTILLDTPGDVPETRYFQFCCVL